VLDGFPRRKGKAGKLVGGEVRMRLRCVLLHKGHHGTKADRQHTARTGTKRFGSCKRLDDWALVDTYAVRRPNSDGVVTGCFGGNKEKSDGALWDTTVSSSSTARRTTIHASKVVSMDGAREGK
jgi:hypothetical protein